MIEKETKEEEGFVKMSYLSDCVEGHLTQLSPELIKKIIDTCATMIEEGRFNYPLNSHGGEGIISDEHKMGKINFFQGMRFSLCLNLNGQIIDTFFLINTLVLNCHTFPTNIKLVDASELIRFPKFE